MKSFVKTYVMAKFFDDNGELNEESLDLLQQDINELLWPSVKRASMLNKAYKTIVEEQSFI